MSPRLKAVLSMDANNTSLEDAKNVTVTTHCSTTVVNYLTVLSLKIHRACRVIPTMSSILMDFV